MDTKEKRIFVIARCMLSKFQDIQVVKAADKMLLETWQRWFACRYKCSTICRQGRNHDRDRIDKVRTQIRWQLRDKHVVENAIQEH